MKADYVTAEDEQSMWNNGVLGSSTEDTKNVSFQYNIDDFNATGLNCNLSYIKVHSSF